MNFKNTLTISPFILQVYSGLGGVGVETSHYGFRHLYAFALLYLNMYTQEWKSL